MASPPIVLDTDILIDHLRSHPPARRFLEGLAGREVCFCAITETELLYGKDCNDPIKREKILKLLARWTKIGIDNPQARIAGDLMRTKHLWLADACIAACALSLGAQLASRNIRDFSRVAALQLVSPYEYTAR